MFDAFASCGNLCSASLVQEGAGSQAFLRSLYQAAWMLRADHSVRNTHHESSFELHSSFESLRAMQAGYDAFTAEAREKGWDVDKVLYRLPPSSSLVRSTV